MECLLYALVALAVPCSYVGLIYAFDDRQCHRNHPDSVKKRFAAVVLNNVVGMAVTYALLSWNYDSPLHQMGFRSLSNTLMACVLPTLLTALFYTGTWMDMMLDGSWRELLDWRGWVHSMQDLLWIRHTLMAPVTEELAFRSCSTSLLLHCFGWRVALFASPLAFALSHFHHIDDDRRQGHTWQEALVGRGFQAVYTYLFGVYATFLFLRTGNIFAPILSHSLCNNLGVPNLDLRTPRNNPTVRAIRMLSLLAGFALWTLLLFPLTAEELYA